MRFHRWGWFVWDSGPQPRYLRPVGIGSAQEGWCATRLIGRLYLISVKPRYRHLQPLWVKWLRAITRVRRGH